MDLKTFIAPQNFRAAISRASEIDAKQDELDRQVAILEKMLLDVQRQQQAVNEMAADLSLLTSGN